MVIIPNYFFLFWVGVTENQPYLFSLVGMSQKEQDV